MLSKFNIGDCVLLCVYLEKIVQGEDTADFILRILRENHGFCGEKSDILRTKNGKPYVKADDLYFSVSHKSDHIIMAVSDMEIGIDMETISGADRTKSAKKILLEWELNEFDSLENIDEKERLFLEFWTKKEAFIKKNNLTLKSIFDVDTTKIHSFSFYYSDFVISFCI